MISNVCQWTGTCQMYNISTDHRASPTEFLDLTSVSDSGRTHDPNALLLRDSWQEIRQETGFGNGGLLFDPEAAAVFGCHTSPPERMPFSVLAKGTRQMILGVSLYLFCHSGIKMLIL